MTRDRMLFRAISTPGLVAEFEKKYGELPVGARAFDDHVVTQMALFLLQSRKPDFLLVYFQDLDHAEHKYGPVSPEAIRALKSIDTDIGILRKAIAAAGFEKQTDIVIVSDHGFLPMSQSFHPNAVLASLNLLGPKDHPEEWRVTSFGGGGSFGLVVHDPNDHAQWILPLKPFRNLKQQGSYGIDQIFDRQQLKAAKGYATSFLAIGMKPGFSADSGDDGPWVTPAQGKGAARLSARCEKYGCCVCCHWPRNPAPASASGTYCRCRPYRCRAPWAADDKRGRNPTYYL